MLNNRKAEELSMNAGKCTRQHIEMCVTHGKCESLLVNAGKLVCMLKSNIQY